jgi:hypothetical protein
MPTVKNLKNNLFQPKTPKINPTNPKTPHPSNSFSIETP